MDASPAAPSSNNASAAAADDNNDIRRGYSYSPSDVQWLGGGGASAGTTTSSTVAVAVQREHMFDKVVTPSDVGKLNRLVIPKQHAEMYFPLNSSTSEKGLLLNFEDRSGKPWRFRYSYWNSSQSYVMTKGWSRFVKDKKLDAGDIVSFHRGVGASAKDRLFIDWRRGPDAPELPPSFSTLSYSPMQYFSIYRSPHPSTSISSSSLSSSPFFLNPQAIQPSTNHLFFPLPNPTNRPHFHSSRYSSYGYGSGSPNCNYNTEADPSSNPGIYLRSAAAATPQQAGMVQMESEWGSGSGGGGGGGGRNEPIIFDSVAVAHGKTAAKRLRLFGVNMDCPISESNECHILSSTTIAHATVAAHPPHLSSSTIPIPLPRPPNQLTLYNGHPMPAMQSDLLNKGKVSNKSFDLDI